MALGLVVGMTDVLWMIALTAAPSIEQVVLSGDRIRIPLGVALIVAGVVRL